MNKIRVAYIIDNLEYGGVQKYVVDIVNNLDRKRFSPYVYCLKKAGPLMNKLENELPVYEFDMKTGNNLSLITELARTFRNENIDVIHSNNWITFVEAVLAKKVSGVPVIIHAQHGMEMNDEEACSRLKRYKRNRVRQILSYFTDSIVVVSEATREFVAQGWKAPEEKIKLIYNGVDITPFENKKNMRFEKRSELGLSEDLLVVGSVGRLMRVKNYTCLLRAFSMIAGEFNGVKLLLVGDGPDKNKMELLAKELNISDMVMFMGTRPDINELLSVMDVFVLPSISEGISLSILEAMASHVPVIASNVGGNPEIINNENGMLFSSDDHVELSGALRILIEEPSRRKEFSISGRRSVEEKFALKRMVKDYENLYLTLLDTKKRQGAHLVDN